MKGYIEWVVRHRYVVIALTLLVTAMALFHARSIKIVIDPGKMMPQSHPYVATSTEVEKVFGSKHVVVIGIHPRQGDIYQPQVLAKVERMTKAFDQVPGVVRENLLSLSAKRAKNIEGDADGLQVKALMARVPSTPAEMEALRRAVANNPVYLDAVVSRDQRTTAVLVEFRDAGSYRAIMDKVEPIVARERDATVDIHVGGLPHFLSKVESYSERMGIFLPISVVILCLVLYEAFRTKQGMILPLVTAVLAVAWGIGVMGASGIPMDAFNATTPILILAVATGHAVQLLKRYYEEYYRLREHTSLTPRQANEQAVVASLQKVGPVMVAAGTVASLGFFSLVIFEIKTVRTFGIFTGLGILAALILEMTFIPALRSVLAPPPDRVPAAVARPRIWSRLTGRIADLVTGPARSRVYIGAVAFALLAAAGVSFIVEDNSVKNYFAPNLDFQRDDQFLNQGLGGTNTLYLLVEGAGKDAIKDPRTLRAIADLQQHLLRDPSVGKTISMADFVRRMNQAMHGDNPAFDTIPDSAELISQYLLLYSMSGDPGDFDSYVDYDYRKAKLTAFLKTDSTANAERVIAGVKAFAATHFPAGVKVHVGGSAPQDAALNDAMVKGKILNIVQIAGVVLLISSLIFRSLVAGCLVLLPLLLAVLANFGLMGWSGILLNIPTSLTSAMAVGIGADYAIYLIYRLREELASQPDEKAAVRNVLVTAGEAILFVAVAVGCGYGVLLLSIGFYIHTWLAILIAAAMLVSALSALLLIPSLILTFRPAFIFGGKAAGGRRAAPAATAMLVLAAAGAAALHSPQAEAAEPDLVALMTRNAQVSKVVDSTSDATFRLINKSGQERVRKVFGTTKLDANGVDNMRMTRFMDPPDVKGTVTLLLEHADRDDDIWVYLPALKKVRRLVSSNKKDSFVGTDFSYADVIGYKVGEWNYKLLREEQYDGQPCYVIESTPKTADVTSNTGYSKRLDWIRKDNAMTVRSDYWDAAGQMLKTSLFSRIEQVDPQRGKWQAMQLEARNVQTGHRTEITFSNFKANQNVKSSFFTTAYMERE